MGSEGPNSPKDDAIRKWLSKIKDLYGEERADKYATEERGLTAYLSALASDDVLPREYSLIDPIDIGGSSVVFRAMHKGLNLEFVVKFNRPIADAAEMVANELNVLPRMNHSNIVRLSDRGSKDLGASIPKLFFLIEPFIKDIMDIDEYFDDYIKGNRALSRERDSRAIANALLERFTKILLQWARSLSYIHSQGYVYLDIKPKNAVVDKDYHVFVIDFGTVQKLDPKDRTGIRVFFTGDLRGHPLAYPWLIRQMGEDLSPGRLRRSIKRSDLHRKFDFYALGQSIIYLLKKVEGAYPSDSPQIPLFRSLHLIATRLLYAQNEEKQRLSLLESGQQATIGETFGGLLQADYETLKYETLDDVVRDLEKETGSWNPELVVPELESNPKEVLRVVPGISTVLTSRLESVIQHPLFARLKLGTELGLISLVYPTADHSRYDHILGSFTFTTRYIVSLFNDRENPIFRNLIDDRDICASLLAALLHDLGQYPLAHDLEEVFPLIFSHTDMSLRLLDDATTDENGSTLLKIIMDKDRGWNIQPDLVKRILGAKSKAKISDYMTPTKEDFKIEMLSALIDGPVDADKADYILRDSLRSGVPYGQQLDIERLLRVLTMAIQGPPLPHKVTLGVYEKGRASAESFGFARYLLFASVYWHHTSRILKSMLQYATALALPKEVFDNSQHQLVTTIREDLADFIISLRPPFVFEQEAVAEQNEEDQGQTESTTKEPPETVLDVQLDPDQRRFSSTALGKWFPGVSVTDWLMLRWIRNLAYKYGSEPVEKPGKEEEAGVLYRKGNKASNLIEGIASRSLYKRVATLPREILRAHNPRLVSELENLTWPDRVQLCQAIQNDIHVLMKSEWKPIDTGPLTKQDKIDNLFKNNLVLLVDVAKPSEKIGFKRPLNIVPELRAKTYYQEVQHPEEAIQWRQSVASLMESIAPVRILCHPSVGQAISKNIKDLRGTFEEAISRQLKKMGKL